MMRKFLSFFATLMISIAAFAQIPPSGTPGSGSPPSATAVPVDSGAIFLVVASAVVGAKKIRNKKKYSAKHSS